MNTKQSRLQEVNRHEVDIEIIECSSFGSVHRTSRGESQTRGWLDLPHLPGYSIILSDHQDTWFIPLQSSISNPNLVYCKHFTCKPRSV